MRIKCCTAVAAAVVMMAAEMHVYAVPQDVDVFMNVNGDVEFAVNGSADGVYVAVYEEDGTLAGVCMDQVSGVIETDTDKTYNASVYFWNDKMQPADSSLSFDDLSLDSFYVTAEKMPIRENSLLRLDGSVLITADGEETELEQIEQIDTADENAEPGTQRLYAYLRALGKGSTVLFGQQNPISHKAGSERLSESDVYDITSDYPAVFGIDTLSLTGDEYSADICNKRYGTDFEQTAKGNVKAAAYLTNLAIDKGMIVTMSAHMPNFSLVKGADSTEHESYAKYDFSGYSTNVLSGDTVNELLEGGRYHEMFKAYLDMIADYAEAVEGSVLFRPFHENTGSWFWWGADFCTEETYKELYRYTVNYLRDEKNIHNILYVYSPGSEFTSAAEFEERYPGDEYVDIVGFDMYYRNPDGSETWYEELEKKLTALDEFAAEHGKVCALAETGISNDTVEGDLQTALLKYGNPDKDWFMKTLDIVSESDAAYFMVWSNFGETDGFYTPYVKKVNSSGTIFGHELIEPFTEFYNDTRSVFAGDQRAALGALIGME